MLAALACPNTPRKRRNARAHAKSRWAPLLEISEDANTDDNTDKNNDDHHHAYQLQDKGCNTNPRDTFAPSPYFQIPYGDGAMPKQLFTAAVAAVAATAATAATTATAATSHGARHAAACCPFLPFEEAMRCVGPLELKDSTEWFAWCKSGGRPSNIPAAPWQAYRGQGWKNIQHWLGRTDDPVHTHSKATSTPNALHSSNPRIWRLLLAVRVLSAAKRFRRAFARKIARTQHSAMHAQRRRLRRHVVPRTVSTRSITAAAQSRASACGKTPSPKRASRPGSTVVRRPRSRACQHHPHGAYALRANLSLHAPRRLIEF